jgi:general stress protein 26
VEREELKNKIMKLIEEAKLGSMATIKDGKPWVRYVVIRPDKGLNFYTTTFLKSRKVEQIKKDNNVNIAIGGDPSNWEKPYLNIQATAEVLTDPESKKKCWHDMLQQFFSGPEDPNYAVIKISAQVIEYMSHGSQQPEIYTA